MPRIPLLAWTNYHSLGCCPAAPVGQAYDVTFGHTGNMRLLDALIRRKLVKLLVDPDAPDADTQNAYYPYPASGVKILGRHTKSQAFRGSAPAFWNHLLLSHRITKISRISSERGQERNDCSKASAITVESLH